MARKEGISIVDLTRELADGRIAAIYLILGEEAFLRDAAVAAIRKAVLAAEYTDATFNSDFVYGDETDAQEILTLCDSLPVFAPRRLVVVRDVGALRARETERLLSYLSSPVETTCLVLVGDRVDGRLKFFQALRAVAVVVDCSRLDEWAMSSWIQQQSASLGLGLDEPARDALAQGSGGDLAVMQREIEKLVAYVMPNARVVAADVEAVRGADRGGTVWDLLEAAGAKDRRRALRVLTKVLEAGEPPLRLLGLLASHWRQVWKAREQLARRVPAPALARLIGVPPFRIPGLVKQARLFSDAELLRCFEAFREADSLLKGGGRAHERRTMERLILALCRGSDRVTSPRAFVPFVPGP